MFSHPPPKPIIPTNPSTPLCLLDLDPTEVARQLTLVEYGLYKNIMPQECLGQAWTKTATRTEKAPNIMAMIARFNQVSRWVATEIVKEQNPRRRGDLLSHIISIAAVPPPMSCSFTGIYLCLLTLLCSLSMGRGAKS